MNNPIVDVALSLGSNVRRYQNINAGLSALEAEFESVTCSPVYESAAVGFDGSPFLNLIALIQTGLPLLQVIQRLKKIEDDNGRERSGPKFSPRTLDIDVVTYGEYSGVLDGVELPRPELFKNAFVLLPMADLWPDRLIPGQAVSYAKLWSEMASQQQVLHRVDLVRR